MKTVKPRLNTVCTWVFQLFVFDLHRFSLCKSCERCIEIAKQWVKSKLELVAKVYVSDCNKKKIM